jgi:long-subunit acyl-CoA synthetase (AMP-forming)
MTEVQQVANTLVGPPSPIPGSLGSALPGVSMGVRFSDTENRTGRFFVRSPFAASGYVGQPDFGSWFDTGDIVRNEGKELRWVARAEEDFFNTGLGIKVSDQELRQTYSDLENSVENLVFCGTTRRAGIVALVFVGEEDPTDSVLHQRLQATIYSSHARLADSGRDLDLRCRTLSAVACVAGRPPFRGPGKVDRRRTVRAQSHLLSAMEDPGSDHPQVMHVPRPAASGRP